jgi:hypothetical protein
MKRQVILETIEELQLLLDEIAVDGARGRLLERGAAWALFRQDGNLPEDAPPLGDGIETDLAEYGFSLLRVALSLRERTGSTDYTRRAFERAARAFEALTTNARPNDPQTGFYRVLGAAAYHLASYSAIAYSLLRPVENANLNAAERALSLLIVRDLSGLRTMTRNYIQSDDHGDASLARMLEDDATDPNEALSIVLNATVCRALAFFDFALQTGDATLVEGAASCWQQVNGLRPRPARCYYGGLSGSAEASSTTCGDISPSSIATYWTARIRGSLSEFTRALRDLPVCA